MNYKRKININGLKSLEEIDSRLIEGSGSTDGANSYRVSANRRTIDEVKKKFPGDTTADVIREDPNLQDDEFEIVI